VPTHRELHDEPRRTSPKDPLRPIIVLYTVLVVLFLLSVAAGLVVLVAPIWIAIILCYFAMALFRH
jgi:hypothetical protein